MPVCEGLPNGPCPSNRNDSSVTIGKGDLLLCSSCDAERRRLFDEELKLKENEKAKEKKNSGRTGSSSKSTALAAENSQSSRSGTSRKMPATVPVTSNLASSSGVQQPQAASNADGPSRSSGAETIINELLAYVAFYRDRGNFTDLHKLIVRFYSPSEISIAKSTITSLFEAHLSGCQYATNRRHTTARPAHEAEAEDILGIFELPHNLQVLSLIQFACSLYGSLAEIRTKGSQRLRSRGQATSHR